LLTLNALVASAGVIVPLQCEFYALEGISSLMRTIEAVRRRFNSQLRLAGILLTMLDRRNSLSGLVEKDARDHFGDWVFDTTIPRNIRVSEAPSHGVPVLMYDPRSPGALSYTALGEEIVKKEKLPMPERAKANG
jgi:chromosome partitioning protein